ncbi:MAG: pyridoxal phosphate-dependent aminotransferase [Anaerolineales bacterium]|nr:pyridoxal phosphate-dependent aminotransferase [Anaerolineales bacterium]
MQPLNRQFELIRQSATVSLTDRILALKAQGKPIISLQVGDPDFGTPPAVADAALAALQRGQTHYAPSNGTSALRRAIAHKMKRDENVEYDSDSEILVTNGGIHAYYSALQSILNPGDDVLIPDPSWATHANMTIMLRGNAVRVAAPAENGFIPPLDSWREALTPRTRAIVLNYPSNPTGAYPSRDYLQSLSEFAAEHDLWIVSDEVYGSLYYGERPTSAAEVAKDRALIVNSLSKSYAMTGWRVGYLAAPPRVIANALKASQNSITCVAPFIQEAAAFALTDSATQSATAFMRAEYAQRRALVLRLADECQSERVIASPPQGAFYFFLDMRPLKMSSVEICERLLNEVGVALMPGSAFGAQGEGFVRLCIAASEADIEAGFRKTVEWAEGQ